MEEQEQKIINLLHLSRKAGKLKIGYDECERACLNGSAKLVIKVSDLAEKSERRLQNLMKDFSIQTIEFGTKSLLGKVFNIRDLGIICIIDKNFAKGISRLVQ